jgi:Flp pilus assembly protein TadD
MKSAMSRRLTVLCLMFTGLAACHRSAQFSLDRGNRLFAEGKFEEAALNYQNALTQDPRSAEFHYRLGLAESKLGNNGDAYREFNAALALAPTREDIIVDRANLS